MTGIRPVPHAGDGGFTLMETLVAIMVLGVSLVLILELFSGGLRSERRASDYAVGMFHAQSVMDEFLLETDYKTAETEGSFDDGYVWSIVYKPYEPPETEDTDATYPVDLIKVDVTVAWKEGRHEKTLTLSTLRLVEKFSDEADGDSGNAS